MTSRASWTRRRARSLAEQPEKSEKPEKPEKTEKVEKAETAVIEGEERLLDTPEGPARVRLHRPPTGVGAARGTVLLGHGAGGQRDSADLARLARGLPDDGWIVVLVDQPWRVAGRTVASPPPRLDAAFVPLAQTLFTGPDALPRPFVSGGRSAGARVACRTAAAAAADAVVAISFPLHPPRAPERSRFPELAAADELGRPLVVVQGERDAFGAPAELVAAGLAADRLRAVRGTHTPNPADVLAEVRRFLDSL